MNAVAAFELVDTLYPEYDFVVSGYRAVAELLPQKDRKYAFEAMSQAYAAGENPFDALVAAVNWIVAVTDGRTATQRNKIEALGLDAFFGNQIYISEAEGIDKTSTHSFERIMDALPAERYVYVGDNPAKDFVAPNRLGWLTVCLRGTDRNVHPQNIEVGESYSPKITVDSIADLCNVIMK